MSVRSPRLVAAARTRRGESGFTVAEMLVTLLVTALILIAVLALFDMTSRTARTQTHVAEMQQSLRVAQQTLVRMVRMAGRGGLPARDDENAASALPEGVALEVANNVPADTLIAGEATARVLEGTDVITVRGVFDSPIYQVDPASTAFAYEPIEPTGSLTLQKRTPTGAPQPLEAVRDAIQAVNGAAGGTHPEALLLVSPLGDWAVVEMVGGDVDVAGGEVESARIDFRVIGGDFSTEYGALSSGGSYPAELKTVAYAGLLEEYQFYVREVREVAGDESSLLMPELVRARLYPNTGVAYQREVASLTQVIADNVLDLQAALGIDHVADQLIDELDDGADAADEWLFNATGDNAADAKWNVATGSPLYYLRINTLVRTDRAEPYYEGEALTTIEDKDYSASPFARLNEEWARRFHRRQLRTIVDLRNL